MTSDGYVIQQIVEVGHPLWEMYAQRVITKLLKLAITTGESQVMGDAALELFDCFDLVAVCPHCVTYRAKDFSLNCPGCGRSSEDDDE